jgi:CO/xanthine dehydrogenase FAD-binding subunit
MNFNVITPETTDHLLEVIAEFQGKKFRFGAGYTDLILELKHQPDADLTVINLANLHDEQFTSVTKTEDGIRLGALVTANRILSDKELQGQFPVLWKSAEELASRQIRQVATIGGNLCTASPAGDIVAALVALEAQCEILSASGG